MFNIIQHEPQLGLFVGPLIQANLKRTPTPPNQTPTLPQAPNPPIQAYLRDMEKRVLKYSMFS